MSDWKEKIAENLRLKYKNRWDGGSISEYDFYEACEEYHNAIEEKRSCGECEHKTHDMFSQSDRCDNADGIAFHRHIDDRDFCSDFTPKIECKNCKYDKVKSEHDKMWCRGCKQKDRYAPKEDT